MLSNYVYTYISVSVRMYLLDTVVLFSFFALLFSTFFSLLDSLFDYLDRHRPPTTLAQRACTHNVHNAKSAQR